MSPTSTVELMAELEERLEAVLEQQRAAAERHQRALVGLEEAIDHLVKTFGLSEELSDDELGGEPNE